MFRRKSLSSKSIVSRLLSQFSDEGRIIVADWRLHIALVRDALQNDGAIPGENRARQLANRMLGNGQLESMDPIRGVYRIVVPFASWVPLADEVIVQEANPRAVLVNFNALAYHGLTYEIPADLQFLDTPAGVLTPPGTTPDDWIDVPSPTCRKPKRVEGRAVSWSQTKKDWVFGYSLGAIGKLPIYVSNLERTLLDTLRFPDQCGGPTSVFQAWVNAASIMDVNRIVDFGERIGKQILKQRIGFVLEELGVNHPMLNAWASKSVRGSSAVLFASRPFAATYSERWCLSLNAEDSELSVLKG